MATTITTAEAGSRSSKLYGELASWWLLLSPPEDYADEAAFFARLFRPRMPRASATLLELGAGGGSNALYLKKLFAETVLTDLSQQMLEVSRALNPDCTHVQGDMRELRLGRVFDAVFIHDAIDFMQSPGELREAIETAYAHCSPGGVALFAPDHVRETFRPSTIHGGSDCEDRALRYLEWSHDPDVNDTVYTVDYTYLLREGGGATRIEHESMQCGLFSRGQWRQMVEAAGFAVEIIHDDYGRDLFLAERL